MPSDKLFGINPVLEALRAGRPIQRLLIAQERKKDRSLQAIVDLARKAGVEVRTTARSALDREAPGAVHQGVIAFAAARGYASLDDILAIPAQKSEAGLYLVLDGVEDPRNLGAIVRTAETAGVHGVIIPERRAAGLTEAVAKSAAGALEYVPVVKVVNIVSALEELKKAGLWVVGADAEGGRLFWDVDLAGPTVIVLGGEDRGVRRLVRETCDHVVSLPLRGQVSSLNVSVVAGVMLYEALRQRSSKTPRHSPAIY